MPNPNDTVDVQIDVKDVERFIPPVERKISKSYSYEDMINKERQKKAQAQ